jgi:hypothetical protein
MGTRAGRSMRVATLFTGVAAMTVGLAQAANAQEGAKPSARPALKHGAGPDAIPPGGGKQSGSIQYYRNCGEGLGTHSHWQHTAVAFSKTSYGFYIPGSDCFGFKGTLVSPSGTGAISECGGNNHGYLYGEDGGRGVNFHFGPGKTYAYLGWSHFTAVVINSWTGNDGCPAAVAPA